METLTTKDLDYFAALRYRIILTPEVDGWSAVIPDLPGCVASGESIEETLILVADAKRSWIEASLLRGLPVPKPAIYGQIEE